MCFPIAIDGHAAGQRIAFIDQPFGQRQPVGRHAFGKRRKQRGDARLDFLALIKPIAADVNLGHAFLAVGQLAHDRRGHRLNLLQLRLGLLDGRLQILVIRLLGELFLKLRELGLQGAFLSSLARAKSRSDSGYYPPCPSPRFG